MEITLAFAASAFIAGLLMFLAPCTLPLVPAYLAFISGVSDAELKDSSTAKNARHTLLVNSLAFVLGFTIIFVLFGVLAGALGAQVGQYRGLLSQMGGVCIILFGLMMLNVISLSPLLKERRIKLPSVVKPGHPSSAFVIGAIFALGWTPCIGPVLASVLLLATTSTTVVAGAIMLLIFSAGLAVPFIITALLYAKVQNNISRISKFSGWFTKVGGVFLILIGVLLLTENFELTVIYGYKVFEFFNFEGFYDYL